MKLHPEIPVFGDPSFRGDCPKEDTEQINFISWLKFHYPLHHTLMIHPQSEGKRNGAQITYQSRTGGMKAGASDCIIPGNPTFVVELKRKDHTKSQWQPKQQDYLLAAQRNGCFIGLALGCDGLKESFLKWMTISNAVQHDAGDVSRA